MTKLKRFNPWKESVRPSLRYMFIERQRSLSARPGSGLLKGQVKMQTSHGEAVRNTGRQRLRIFGSFTISLLALIVLAPSHARAQDKIILTRQDATVMLEPYAPNILRVTLSLRKPDAIAAPGCGIKRSLPHPVGRTRAVKRVMSTAPHAWS